MPKITAKTTVCTCMKCGHSWTPRIDREAIEEKDYFQAVTVTDFEVDISKCPNQDCGKRRWDISGDGRAGK